jgi:hypothetical protein
VAFTGGVGRQPGRSPQQTVARATICKSLTQLKQPIPLYLIQNATPQSQAVFDDRHSSVRQFQRIEIRQFAIEGRGMRHEKAPPPALNGCQTADRRRRQVGTAFKRRASSRPFYDTSTTVVTHWVEKLRAKNRRKIDRFRSKIYKSAATMPAPRANDKRGNGSDSRRPAMPDQPRRVRSSNGPRRIR